MKKVIIEFMLFFLCAAMPAKMLKIFNDINYLMNII